MDARTFALERSRRFGTGNPTRMDCEFWIHMIRTGASAYSAREEFDPGSERRGGGPVWCFDRFGATRTALPDGRIVCIGGEHEAFYDPDFCIYNDVVVLAPDGGIEIYGYPREVFPPTDFHTATLVDGRIVIIGCLGYAEQRRIGHTPVYELDLATWRMAPMHTSGEMPGWLYGHYAQPGRDGAIVVTGGRQFVGGKKRRAWPANAADYELDCRTGAWRRLPAQNWTRFHIRPLDPRVSATSLPDDIDIEQCLPSEYSPPELPPGEPNCAVFVIAGVPISMRLNTDWGFDLAVEGQLPPDRVHRIVEKLRSYYEVVIERKCIVDSFE